jgi:hypothetical protein
MPGTKCPTVRSGGTTSRRSALMPILMTSRASMDNHIASFRGASETSEPGTSRFPDAQLRI